MRQIVGADVSLDVVDGDQRLVKGIGKSLGAAHARQQRTHQPGAVGHGDGVNVVKGHLRFLQRLIHHAVNGVHMGAAGDLGDHAAVYGMQRNLRKDGV